MSKQEVATLKYINGFPCHKYIIRKLLSDNEILEFERAFIDVLSNAGEDDESILMALTLMEQHIPADSPIAGKHFDIDGNVNMGDFINNIRFDNGIPSHKNCRSYYRKYDTHYAACKACPHSPLYKNGNLENEHKIIRFMITSKDNFLYLKDKIKAGDFESVYDIMEYAIVSKPLLFPFYKNVCEFYMNRDRNDADFSGKELPETLLDELISKLKIQRPPKEFMSEGWDERYGGFLAEILFKMEEPSKKQIDNVLKDFSVYRKKVREDKTKKKNKKCKEELQPEDSLKTHHEYQQTLDSLEAAHAHTYNNQDREVKNVEYNEGRQQDIPSETISRTEIIVYSGSTTGNNGQESDFIEVIDNIEDLGESVFVEAKELTVGKYEEPGGNKIPYHPTVFQEELEAIAINLDVGTTLMMATFEQTAVSDGRVCVECIFTEQEKMYLLFYIRGLRNFFYTSLEEGRGGEVALSILQREGVSKICYSALLLYGFVRVNKGFIKNMYSIESIAALLQEQCDYGLETYASAVKARESVPGDDYDRPFEAISPVLKYMPSYYWIKGTQSKKMLQKNVKDQEIPIRMFDEAVSTGYITASYLYMEGYSLQMQAPGTYRFRNQFNRQPKERGRFIRYEILVEREDKIALIRDVCCSLAQNGIFRRYGIYIMQIYKQGIEFFIKEEDVEFATTMISVNFLNVFGEKGIRRIELQTSYRVDDKADGNTGSLLSKEDLGRIKELKEYMEKTNTANRTSSEQNIS